MRPLIEKCIQDHQLLIDKLLKENVHAIEEGCKIVKSAIENNGKILIAGNGGSAADSQHFAAEFIGRFSRERLPLPALALTTDTSILTAIGNDYGFDTVFSRQIQGLCSANDVFIAISTSGNSRNLIYAVQEANKKGATTIGLLGGSGGELGTLVNHPIIINSKTTARIQECHILIAHIICEVCDE